MVEKEFYKVSEVAIIFGYGESTIRTYLKRGHVPGRLEAGGWRIPADYVERARITGIQVANNINFTKSLQKACTRRVKTGGRRPWES